MNRLLTIILFFCACISAYSQSAYTYLSTKDGLPSSHVFSTKIDRNGYLWIGSNTGLSKYDGRDIVNYTRDNGLLSDNIYDIFEDTKGRLWVNNLNGEPLYIYNDKIYNRHIDPTLQLLKSRSYKYDIMEDDYGKIWFVSDDYVYVYDDKKVDTLNYIEGGSGLRPYLIIANRGKYISVFTKGSIINIDAIDYTLMEKKDLFDIPYFAFRTVDHKNSTYYWKSNLLYRFDHLTDKEVAVHNQYLKANPTGGYCESDTVFYTSVEGIYYIYSDTLRKYEGIDLSNFSSSVSSISKDKIGNWWISSLEAGVMSKKSIPVMKSEFDLPGQETFIGKSGKDTILIGVGNDLYTYFKSKLVDIKTLPNPTLYGISKLVSVHGDTWISTRDRLYRDFDDKGKNSVVSYHRDVLYDSEYDVFYFTNEKGVFYISGREFMLLNDEKLKVSGYLESKLMLIPLSHSYQLLLKGNKLLVSSEMGLYSLERGNLNPTLSLVHSGSITKLSSEGNYIIGVDYGTGLFALSTIDGSVRNFGVKDGLLSPYVQGFSYDDGNIWISHSKGISQILFDNGTFYKGLDYGHVHGVPHSEINVMEFVDGRFLHFVSDDIVYKIDINILQNDSIKVTPLDFKSEYYADQSFSITYDCINLNYSNDIAYKYRLLPIDTSWHQTQDEKITLQNLEPNQYTLQVKASEQTNLPSPITDIEFTVVERWYKSKTLYGVLLFVLSGITYFMFSIKALVLNKSMVKNILKKYLFKDNKSYLKFKDIQGIHRSIVVDDIVYIHSSGNYINIYVQDVKYVVRMTMKDVTDLLQGFIGMERVHRSYIANLSKMKGFDGKAIIFSEDMQIPYSTTYKKQVESHFQN